MCVIYMQILNKAVQLNPVQQSPFYNINTWPLTNFAKLLFLYEKYYKEQHKRTTNPIPVARVNIYINLFNQLPGNNDGKDEK